MALSDLWGQVMGFREVLRQKLIFLSLALFWTISILLSDCLTETVLLKFSRPEITLYDIKIN